MNTTYRNFLESKVTVANRTGMDVSRADIHADCFPHQKDAIQWAVGLGRALIAMSFGLGKTRIQCEIARLIHLNTGKKFLVICPLGVKHQFIFEDGPILGVSWEYCKTDDDIKNARTPFIITNYERVRDGNITPALHDFAGVSLDEGSVLRSLGSKTYQVFIDLLKDIPYRYVATATPAPNEYKEIIHYAEFLGIMDRGQALAQPLDAKVLTPQGWMEMGNIQRGDKVIAADGTATTVMGVYPQGEKKIYRVLFSDGSSTECTEDHLWLTRTHYERNNERRYNLRTATGKNDGSRKGTFATVKPTSEIADTLVSSSGDANHEIPLVAPIQFKKREVRLDPWLMGFLLGDGHLRSTSVHFSTADEWIVEHVRQIATFGYGLSVYKVEHERADKQPNYDYRISSGEVGGRGPGSNLILKALRSYGLLGKRAWEKSIPHDYLFNSPDVRLAVLQGLMDADGTIHYDGGQCRLTTTSQALADNAVFIARSLGGTATITIRKGRTPKGEPGRIQYRVTLRLPNGTIPFALPRKADLATPHVKYQPKRFIMSVEEVGTKPAQCIAVAHPERLYVTDNFIVTHNTRWFKRDSGKAGHLTIHPIHERDFWMWVASWALFLFTPGDLGYSDEGYSLPPLKVHWHRIKVDQTRAWSQTDNRNQHRLFLDAAGGVSEAAAEKRATLPDRVKEMKKIIKANPSRHWLLWHHMEDERRAIEKEIKGAVTVYGSQDLETREERILGFAHGDIPILATKPEIAGSGCNFQYYCHSNIFLGVDYKFQDFIQAIHRTYRFQQAAPVDVHIIYAESEDQVVEVLKRKWEQHNRLVDRMREIVRNFGMATTAIQSDLSRSIGILRMENKQKLFTAINNDCVLEMENIESDHIDLIHTSIPFGNHYEYSAQYEDFGHNPTDGNFWQQMDYLIPELLRVLKPGRLAAIHVKDRILYGHQTPTGFMEVSPFSDECVMAFRKHGFLYEGRRTIVTDVVRENASTYRLGWSEMTRDASKMGSGLPEYLLLFRKPPTSNATSRADEPVTKDKADYTRARWQLDASSFWRSNGNTPLTPAELYHYEAHVGRLEELDRKGGLSASFLMEPPKSLSEQVWDDIVYMRTLNSEQSKKKLENHICPLPFDIVERTIRLYSNEGDLVLDPFAGLFTVPIIAMKLDRVAHGIELNPEYYQAGVRYCEQMQQEKMMPTLFDYMETVKAAA